MHPLNQGAIYSIFLQKSMQVNCALSGMGKPSQQVNTKLTLNTNFYGRCVCARAHTHTRTRTHIHTNTHKPLTKGMRKVSHGALHRVPALSLLRYAGVLVWYATQPPMGELLTETCP